MAALPSRSRFPRRKSNQRDPRARGGGPERQQGLLGGDLRFDIRASFVWPSRSSGAFGLRDQRITREGVLVIKSQHAPQPRANREEALARCTSLWRAGRRSAAAPADPATRSSQRKRSKADAPRRVKKLRGRIRPRGLGRELLQLLLLLEPLGFELRQLPRDEGLVDDQRLQDFFLGLSVYRRTGELSVDRGLLRVELRHFSSSRLIRDSIGFLAADWRWRSSASLRFARGGPEPVAA